MAFMIHSTDDGRVPPLEYLPCGAIAPQVGMALKQDGGLLAAATGTDTPAYISMCQRENACGEGELIPVIRLQADMILGTAFAAAADGLALGDKLTIDGEGMLVTATTGGPAELVGMHGTAAGDGCLVRFG